jgi:hypothetical protein
MSKELFKVLLDIFINLTVAAVLIYASYVGLLYFFGNYALPILIFLIIVFAIIIIIYQWRKGKINFN